MLQTSLPGHEAEGSDQGERLGLPIGSHEYSTSQRPPAPEAGDEAVGARGGPLAGARGRNEPQGENSGGLRVWEGEGVISLWLGFGRLLPGVGKIQSLEK